MPLFPFPVSSPLLSSPLLSAPTPKEEFRKWEREEAKLRGVEKNRGAQKSKSVDDAEAAKSKIEG